MPYTHITQNLLRIRAELAEIAKKRGTAPATLVAVTKSAPDDEVLALAAAGAEHMAENRVQNYRARRELLDAKGYDVVYHESAGNHSWGYWDKWIQDILNWLPIGRK